MSKFKVPEVEDYTFYKIGSRQVFCELCLSITRSGKVTKHRPWNCRKYNTPMKARDRLIELDRCAACGIKRKDHGEECEPYYHTICSTNEILDLGTEIGYHANVCHECDSPHHLTWTCDGPEGEPHPGSQFKKSFETVSVSRATTLENGKSTQQDKADKEKPRINSENLESLTSREESTNKQDTDLESSIGEITADKCQKDALIEKQTKEIEDLKSQIKNQNDYIADRKEYEDHLMTEMLQLQSKKDKTKHIKHLESLNDHFRQKIKQMEMRKGNSLEVNIDDIIEQHEKESNKYMDLLALIFPDEKIDGNIDNMTLIDIFENKVKSTGCGSAACIKKLQDAVEYRVYAVDQLEQQLDQLCDEYTALKTRYEEEMSSKETNLQFSAKESKQEDEAIDLKNKRIETLQQRLDNIEEQYRSQTQEMNQKEKVINCNNETIKNLQQKLSTIEEKFTSQTQEIIKKDEIINQNKAALENCQEVFQRMNFTIHSLKTELLQKENQSSPTDTTENKSDVEDSHNTKENKLGKSEVEDSNNTKENKLGNSGITRSDVENILKEIENMKTSAAEHRKNSYEKINTFCNDFLLKTLKRRMIRYRCERGSQIASFENRIKREFCNMMNMANNEDMRLLENKCKQDKQDLDQRIKVLETKYKENDKVIKEDFNIIKKSNEELRKQLNEKENNLSKFKKLFTDITNIKVKNNKDKSSRKIKKKKPVSTKSERRETVMNQKFNTHLHGSVVLRPQLHITSLPESTDTNVSRLSKGNLSNNSSLSNNHKNMFTNPQDVLEIIKPTKEENTDICPEIKMNYEKSDLLITNSKRIRRTNHNSTNVSETNNVLNRKKEDLCRKQSTKTYGFAIRLDDNILLYDKDPRLRMNLGNKTTTTNKFECLKHNILYEERIFREI